jgi:Pin2-interacting protein X1
MLMKQQGWEEGRGLGKDQQGNVKAVQVSKKDDMKGLGYSSAVAQTWSKQSVDFSDVLSRISKSNSPAPDESDESSSPTTGAPHAGKHANAFLKRRRLKTEGLTSATGKNELLNKAGQKTVRGESDDTEDSDSDDKSMLTSTILRRLMARAPKLEPKATPLDEATIAIVKPKPRPPRCTETPFLQ